MPRDSSGNYSLPAGNPVVGGTTITATWANPTMSDIGDELTNSLDRNGRGGMLAPFKFADGLVGAPGITWNSEPTSGFFRAGGNDMQAVIAGVPRMRWTASDVSVWDTGTSTWLPIIGPSGSNFALTNSPNVFTVLSTNTFNAATLFNATVTITASNSQLVLHNAASAGLNSKNTLLRVDTSGSFAISSSLDATPGSAAANAFAAARTGSTWNSLVFGNATNNPTFTFAGTGATTFGGQVTTTSFANGGGFRISNVAPYYGLQETDAGADGQNWRMIANTNNFLIQTQSDDFSTARTAFSATRSGLALTNITLGNATDNPTLNFLGTGASNFTGPVTVQRLNIDDVRPTVSFNETDQGADLKRWRIDVQTAVWALETVDDAVTASKRILGFTRGGGNSIAGLAFGNATDNPTFTFTGTGIISAGGVIRGPAGITGAPTYTAPTYSFSGDPNTGIVNSSTDALGLVVGGGERVRITNDASPLKITGLDASGEVFIGFFESLAFTTRKGYVGYGHPTGDQFSIMNEENAAIEIGTNSSIRLTIAADGTLTSTGVHRGPDGSISAPAFSFSSDTDCGMSLPNAGRVIISAGAGNIAEFAGSPYTGTNRVIITNIITIPAAGTAAAPPLCFETDLTTGLYRIGASALGFTEGGAGFRIGFRSVPVSSTTTTLAIGDVGKCVPITAAINIPISVFAAGDAVSIYNDSAGSLNITISAGTLRLAGTATTGTRAVAQRGMVTLWFRTGGATPEVIASGSGLS